ncbi:MAG: F0F1 ATP synthase subunit B', partial [Alphaproteobacteria bacterium]|nr:F0F1 ATP synthase subunit B' [Alphaproteobacteria bacterium]
MPQMEFATYAPQLIWLLITFVVLYLLMARVALPRIAGALEARRERIAEDLERAEAFKKSAEAAL